MLDKLTSTMILSGVDGRSLSADVASWNPFEEATPFAQLTEDHIFGAEFDKIRQGSGSQSSKCYLFLISFFLSMNVQKVSSVCTAFSANVTV